MQNDTGLSWSLNVHFSAGMPNKHPVRGMDYLSWNQIAALQTSSESVTIRDMHISIKKKSSEEKELFYQQILSRYSVSK